MGARSGLASSVLFKPVVDMTQEVLSERTHVVRHLAWPGHSHIWPQWGWRCSAHRRRLYRSFYRISDGREPKEGEPEAMWPAKG